MQYLKGKYSGASIHSDNIDETSKQQIKDFCDCEAFSGSRIVVMPDVHAGNGCVVGMAAKTNRIIPSLIGPDIGCGMTTTFFSTEKPIDFTKLDEFIKNNIPTGFNIRKNLEFNCKYSDNKLRILRAIEDAEDSLFWVFCTDKNKKDVFLRSLGTLGGGNHFIEIGQLYTDQQYTTLTNPYSIPDMYKNYNHYIMIVHSGSRGLGMKVFNHYHNIAKQSTKKDVPNNLFYLPRKNSNEYLAVQSDISNFAQANRTVISKFILDAIDGIQHGAWFNVHNSVISEGRKYVHRKGCCAITSGIMAVPLNMRDGSVLCKSKYSVALQDYIRILETIPHGAGRALSRTEAKNTITLDEYKTSMKDIYTSCINEDTLDESPMAYKDPRETIDYLNKFTTIIGFTKSLYNFKG